MLTRCSHSAALGVALLLVAAATAAAARLEPAASLRAASAASPVDVTVFGEALCPFT